MKMALDTASGVNVVRSYEPGAVEIGNRRFTASLLVLPDLIHTDWPPTAASELQPRHFRALLDNSPEVLILGTGDTQDFPEPSVFVTLMDMAIGFEVMNNAAACRTYNILLSEGRRAALALMLPGAP